jgi:LmbE family N-acetylglucosaminyl deacetylase
MKTLVVAPHPDDEILGVGGTLLRRKAEGASVAWLIISGVSQEFGWPQERVVSRHAEIECVNRVFGFDAIFKLELPTTRLDTLPIADIVKKISECIQLFQPDEVFIPHGGDVHSDHTVVYDAVVSCTKSFRCPFIRRILSYETISETDYGLDASKAFFPNYFVDISGFIDRKLDAMMIYNSEVGQFPFPRSRQAIEALARYRGASSGFSAAEAFQLLRERS